MKGLEREIFLLEEEFARAEQAFADVEERARMVAIEADAARDSRQLREAVARRRGWRAVAAACVGFIGGFLSGVVAFVLLDHLFPG
jgi:hypothetical protein